MRILVVGAERLGRVLAAELSHAGHDVRVLDGHRERLRALPRTLAADVRHGSALDRAVLADAVAGCDAVAVVTPDDAFNAVVAIAARRELRVPLAAAVVGNPRRAEALAGLGAHVVCPTTWTARELHMTLVRSGVDSELPLGDEAGVYRAEITMRLAGRALSEIERPGELIPIAVERGGHVLMAAPGLELAAGDVLHIAARTRDHVADLVRP